MKRLILILFAICVYSAHSETITLDWRGPDGTTVSTTTCESGGDLTLPTAPTKTGYNFVGWSVPKYYPLEYIENTISESVIDTGFIPDYDTKVVIEYEWLYRTTNSDCKLLVNNKIGLNATMSNYPNYERIIFNNINLYTPRNNRHITSFNKNSWYIDDVLKNSFSSAFFLPENNSLKIFSADPCIERLYSLQLYQNDVLVHDYVPAMKPDGIVCLYDKVTDTFLYNSGSEPLVAGPMLDYE